ncbi:MAG: undecaprenyldiphospho-muramoylpentapeptide beta-N-acetylglucosaminyltransferase [Clostridia bacterium]|nr:undecaprenyldiphospho-muramoylpentapeptide beta-N-acetylglucosaminyltransferase [Clostridia bacterium]
MKVIIAGGGTAGHINPGIAIAKYIKDKNKEAEILFIGTQKGLETRLVPREGFELQLIKVRGFKRKVSADTFVAFKELFQGLYEARKILKSFKPDIVIGTGGYVCGPVLFNASMMKIPTLVHEQNAYPGITNRILARYVDRVAISFKESERFFKSAKKIKLTGNPIRSEILSIDKKAARKTLKLEGSQKLVVIFGGSRGAERINKAVTDMILRFHQPQDFNIIFATGESMYQNVMEKLKAAGNKSVEVVPYIYDMGTVMAAADLAVCRAGAITISELTALGIPSVIIPSPYVTANHQEHNARSLEKFGAASVILEKNLNGDVLYREIKELIIDKERLINMSEHSKKIGKRNAVESIYDMVKEMIQ